MVFMRWWKLCDKNSRGFDGSYTVDTTHEMTLQHNSVSTLQMKKINDNYINRLILFHVPLVVQAWLNLTVDTTTNHDNQ